MPDPGKAKAPPPPPAQAPTSKDLVGGGGGGDAAAGTQSPNLDNLSQAYASSPGTYGVTSADMNLGVRTQHVPLRDDATKNYMGPVGPAHIGGDDPTQGVQPLWKWMAKWQQESRDAIMQKQIELYNAGFYDASYYAADNRKPIATGTADENFIKALHEAGLESIRSNGQLTPDEVIAQRSQANQQQSGGTRPYQTNTENITSAVKALGPQILGREVPDEVVNKIVDTLHGSEDAAAQGQTGTQTAVQGDQAWYAEQLKELMPHTAKAYQTFEGLMSANFGPVNNLGSNG